MFVPNGDQVLIDKLGNSHYVHAHNIHKRSYPLTEKLTIVGHGGSVPTWNDPETEADLKYIGFPYSHESELREDLKHSESLIAEFSTKPEDQILFMTHAGPHTSQTSKNWNSPTEPPTELGSKTISTIIAKNNEKILLNVHGHSHEGHGYTTIGSTTVLNPGSMSHGRFCTVTLARKETEPGNFSLWELEKTDFMTLDFVQLKKS